MCCVSEGLISIDVDVDFVKSIGSRDNVWYDDMTNQVLAIDLSSVRNIL